MQRRTSLWIVALLLTLAPLASAQPTSAPTTAGSGRGRGRGAGGPPPSATMPAMQGGTQQRQDGFRARAQKGDIDLLFLGDSITDFWQTEGPRRGGKAVWTKYFEPLKAADFAINAARTQNVLWQTQNGMLDGFKAKCIVMMLGTNNLTVPTAAPRNTDEETLAGLKLVINEIRTRQPDAKLLLLAIFPRGQAASDPYREHIKHVNSELAKYDDGKHIFFMDIGSKFLEPDGAISQDMMSDYLHPTEKGYQIWADAIIDKVKELLGSH